MYKRLHSVQFSNCVWCFPWMLLSVPWDGQGGRGKEKLAVGNPSGWEWNPGPVWVDCSALQHKWLSSCFFFSPSPDNIAEVEVTVEMDDASQSIHRKSAKSKQQRKLWVALQNGSYLFSSHALTVQWFTSRRVVWLTYAHTVFLYCSLD